MEDKTLSTERVVPSQMTSDQASQSQPEVVHSQATRDMAQELYEALQTKPAPTREDYIKTFVQSMLDINPDLLLEPTSQASAVSIENIAKKAGEFYEDYQKNQPGLLTKLYEYIASCLPTFLSTSTLPANEQQPPLPETQQKLALQKQIETEVAAQIPTVFKVSSIESLSTPSHKTPGI